LTAAAPTAVAVTGTTWFNRVVQFWVVIVEPSPKLMALPVTMRFEALTAPATETLLVKVMGRPQTLEPPAVTMAVLDRAEAVETSENTMAID
jgi:hypothetical protein